MLLYMLLEGHVCSPRGPGACALCASLSSLELHWPLGYLLHHPRHQLKVLHNLPGDRKTHKEHLEDQEQHLIIGSMGAEWPRGTGSQI